jgi:hypothetical protein
VTIPTPTIRIAVGPTNPGQFFACCGLLELADRLWQRAEVVGSFSAPRFQRFAVLDFRPGRFVLIRPCKAAHKLRANGR